MLQAMFSDAAKGAPSKHIASTDTFALLQCSLTCTSTSIDCRFTWTASGYVHAVLPFTAHLFRFNETKTIWTSVAVIELVLILLANTKQTIVASKGVSAAHWNVLLHLLDLLKHASIASTSSLCATSNVTLHYWHHQQHLSVLYFYCHCQCPLLLHY